MLQNILFCGSVYPFERDNELINLGVTFAFFKVNVVLAVSIIGIITFILSLVGVKIGNRFGDKFQSKAELAGGIILIIIGTKILLEHLVI